MVKLAVDVGTPGFVIDMVAAHSQAGEPNLPKEFDLKFCRQAAAETLSVWNQLNEVLYPTSK